MAPEYTGEVGLIGSAHAAGAVLGLECRKRSAIFRDLELRAFYWKNRRKVEEVAKKQTVRPVEVTSVRYT
jgi:hypothetical protein